MKQTSKLLISTIFLFTTLPASAENEDPGNHCRKEAQEYGIQEELVQDYVTNCILSLGGMPDPSTQAMDGGQTNLNQDSTPQAPIERDPQLEGGQYQVDPPQEGLDTQPADDTPQEPSHQQ